MYIYGIYINDMHMVHPSAWGRAASPREPVGSSACRSLSALAKRCEELIIH